jgi:diadenylate cyclase
MWDELTKLSSIIEVIILSILFYLILRAAKGTRAAAILKGLIFIMVVALISILLLTEWIGLYHIQYLLQWVLSGFFFAIIVIFYPEIRRGLLRLAQTHPLSLFFKGSSPQLVDELVGACEILSHRRIGAILVLERQVSLSEFTDNATMLNATLSKELITTLFYPGSPLHDGALLVKDGRILAAGCLLPLTEKPDLSRSFGTRHRAAIGITEETDAISIVISEETGRISLCTGGNIIQDLQREQLFKVLHELYTEKERYEEGA